MRSQVADARMVRSVQSRFPLFLPGDATPIYGECEYITALGVCGLHLLGTIFPCVTSDNEPCDFAEGTHNCTVPDGHSCLYAIDKNATADEACQMCSTTGRRVIDDACKGIGQHCDECTHVELSDGIFVDLYDEPCYVVDETLCETLDGRSCVRKTPEDDVKTCLRFSDEMPCKMANDQPCLPTYIPTSNPDWSGTLHSDASCKACTLSEDASCYDVADLACVHDGGTCPGWNLYDAGRTPTSEECSYRQRRHHSCQHRRLPRSLSGGEMRVRPTRRPVQVSRGRRSVRRIGLSARTRRRSRLLCEEAAVLAVYKPVRDGTPHGMS